MSSFLIILLLLSLAITGLFVIRRWPDQTFWIILLLLFDPTGHFHVYLGKDALGGFYYRDFLFPLAFVPIFFLRMGVKEALRFKPFQVMIGVQVLFLLYQIFVHGYWQSGESWSYVFRYVLVRERMSVFGFLLIMPAFVMARRNLSFFADLLVLTTVVVYTLYFITILGGPDLLPVWQAERYQGSGILRYAMYSTGLTEMLIPLALFVLIRGIPYRYRSLLFMASVMVMLAIFLSLTKSSYIGLAGLVAGSLFLFFRFYPGSFPGLVKVTTGGLLAVLAGVMIAFPDYPELVWRQVQDLWLFLTGDAYTSGVVEGRLVNQWPAHWSLIHENPWLGTGSQFSSHFSLRFQPSDYEVTDLPITGHLAMYGVVGLAIYSLFYIVFWHYLVKGYRWLRRNARQINALDMAFYFVVFAWMIKTFFLDSNYLFNELSTATLLVNVYAGLLLAVLFRSFQKPESL